MNLQDLRYLVAVVDHQHFGRAAASCHISQPTLSFQIRKLEAELGVTLLERTNKRVQITPVGHQVLAHARRALGEVQQMEEVAAAFRDPFHGPLRLGVIPTLAPYLMPLILNSLREEFPSLRILLQEKQTHALIEDLRSHRLDAALLATIPDAPEITHIVLFEEPLLAALPPEHRLASAPRIQEEELAGDLLVLAEGHCLANQALAVCGTEKSPRRHHMQEGLQAATLETLVNLVAARYGTTLIPALARDALSQRGILVRPLEGNPVRTIRLVSRPGFPRPQALRALEKMICKKVKQRLAQAGLS